MEYLLYPLAIYALVMVGSYLIIFQRLMKVMLQYPQYQLQTEKQVPGYVREVLQQSFADLEAWDFILCGYLQIEDMLSLELAHNWAVLLYNSALKAYAKVEIRRPIEPGHLFDVEFLTLLQDGTLLLTINGKAHGILDSLPNTVIYDGYTPCLQAQWQAHQQQLAQVSDRTSPSTLAPDQFIQRLQAHFKGYLDGLARAGKISPISGTGAFQLSPGTALKTALKIGAGSRKVRALLKQQRKRAKTAPPTPVVIPVALEVEGFRRMQQLEQGRVQRKRHPWVLLGSLGLFVASFTPLLDGPTLLALVAVVGLHELGHLLAMRLFGYRDTSIFFLPFFGAAAVGQKDNATLLEKTGVLLAGPLPGLLLGIGLEITFPGNALPLWLHETNWLLIGVNLFNLLPIYPLDGGKIANLLLFARYPHLDLLFKIFAVVALVLLGRGSPIALAIAALVSLTIPAGFRSAQVNAQLQQKQGPQPLRDDDLLPAIFQTISHGGYSKLPFIHRYTLAKEVLQRQRESQAPWTTRLSLLLLYCLSLVGGMAGGYQAIAQTYGTSKQEIASYRKQQEASYQTAIEQAYRALQANPKDAQAYLARATAYHRQGNYQAASEDYTQFLRFYPKDQKAYLRRAQVHYVMRDYRETVADTSQVIRLNPKAARAYSLRSFARRHLGDRQGAIADMKQAEALYEAQWNQRRFSEG